MFNNLKQGYGDGFGLSSEEARIENAFRRKDSKGNCDEVKHVSHSGDFATDMKTSSSMHGISNPNYGNSPTSSRTTSLENVECNISANEEPSKCAPNNFKKATVKKASLFAWMTLQSVPEETIISPHILEFLEQTLEPIPAKTTFNTNGINLDISFS